MHLAILMTNTDESPFADCHPRDGEKFTALIQNAKPHWTTEVFAVKDDVFPTDISHFDGVIVTGSPASVHDSAPWIPRLLDLLRDSAARQIPMYGACFGHQAIALALGGAVTDNPDGWVLGSVTTHAPTDGTATCFYAAHKEQVTTLPPLAKIVHETDGCPNAGFRIGDHILTTQYHPEMTDGFIAALVDELKGALPSDVITAARSSLRQPADRDKITNDIITFFETGAQTRQANDTAT